MTLTIRARDETAPIPRELEMVLICDRCGGDLFPTVQIYRGTNYPEMRHAAHEAGWTFSEDGLHVCRSCPR